MRAGFRRLLDALQPFSARTTPTGWTFRCPAHKDQTPSLEIKAGDNGSPLVKCWGGCSTEAVLAALGLTWADVLRDDGDATSHLRSVRHDLATSKRTEYQVCNRAGDIVAIHVRTDKPAGCKGFTWRRPGGIPGLGGIPVVRLPLFGAELLDGHDGPVYLCEGERAALALRNLGVLSLGTVTGAAAIPSTQSLEVLRDRDVLLWPDHDDAGRVHMRRISETLRGIAKSVRVISWGTQKGDDAADFVEVGGTRQDLEKLLVDAKASDGECDPPRVTLARPVRKDAIEPLPPAAYHGPLGALVRILEPQTEADPAAVFLQLLAAFGSVVGGGPYAIGGSRHHANLFVAVIGKTAKARKGVSFHDAIRVFSLFAVGELWKTTRVLAGLSTGEGIVSAVRDPMGEEDDGEPDKRVLFREEELARVLAAAARQGSTLNAVLRSAWDSSPLGIVTKAQKMHCAEPHVSVVAHCTRHELSAMLAGTDVHNGLANRFLWVWATRSKILPHGGTVGEEDLREVALEISAAVDAALRLRDAHVPWREDAGRLWTTEYPKLSADRPGSLGAILARSEAQVLRLSLVFALADQSRTMNPEHLKAALEVWRYCEDSARVIFGDKSGDKTLDKILAVIGRAQEPVTPAQVGEALGWNLKAPEIAFRLEDLHAAGWIEPHDVVDGRGRPVIGWTLSSLAGKIAA